MSIRIPDADDVPLMRTMILVSLGDIAETVEAAEKLRLSLSTEPSQCGLQPQPHYPSTKCA